MELPRRLRRLIRLEGTIAATLVLFFATVALVTVVRAQAYADDSASDSVSDCSPGSCFKGRFFQSLCVNPGGTDGCESSISAAVAEISLSDVVITVAPGTYVDNVLINASANPIPASVTRKPLKLTITSSSTAAATIINGNGAGPVFTIGSNAKVELDGLTITNGAGGPVQEGTGGGGILANGNSLQINSCVISDNQAEYGAGIYANDIDLDVENSVISGNVGQGDDAQGGGVYYASAKARKLKIVSSTIDGNSASFSAGGILLYGGVPIRSSAEIIDSTISDNTTDNTTSDPGGGAGLDIFFVKLTLLNSTISGNNAAGVTDAGGAMRTTLSDVSLDNVTVANNSAGETAGGIDATSPASSETGKSRKDWSSAIQLLPITMRPLIPIADLDCNPQSFCIATVWWAAFQIVCSAASRTTASKAIRCLVLFRTTADQPTRRRCCRAVLLSERAIRKSQIRMAVTVVAS